MTGRNRLLDIALELERIALEDEYFISRKLYPNVDFYSGIIYQAMGLPVAMFPVVRDSSHRRLVSAMAGNDHRLGAKDHPPAPNLCRTAAPRIAEEEGLTNCIDASMKLQMITLPHLVSRSSPTDVFQNSNKYLQCASVRVSPAIA